MIKHFHLLALAAIVVGSASVANSQILLSDFSADTGSWDPDIQDVTPFSDGFTSVSRSSDNGGELLVNDTGGNTGGAYATYTTAPTTGYITVFADIRVDNDAGNGLVADPAGDLSAVLGVAAGNGDLAEQAYAYSSGVSTAADDSGQAFARYAAAVPADGSGNVNVIFSPNPDNYFVSAPWSVRIDNLTIATGGSTTVLDDSEGALGWVEINNTNSIIASADPFSTLSMVDESGNQVFQLQDGGFTGGAYKTFAAALNGPGVYTVVVSVRIKDDNEPLERARIAGVVGGPSTDYRDYSFSNSFATASDDTGSAFQDVALAVSTTAPGVQDLTIYVLPDYDGGVDNTGANYQIQVDTIELISGQTLPVELDSFLVE